MYFHISYIFKERVKFMHLHLIPQHKQIAMLYSKNRSNWDWINLVPWTVSQGCQLYSICIYYDNHTTKFTNITSTISVFCIMQFSVIKRTSESIITSKDERLLLFIFQVKLLYSCYFTNWCFIFLNISDFAHTSNFGRKVI